MSNLRNSENPLPRNISEVPEADPLANRNWLSTLAKNLPSISEIEALPPVRSDKISQLVRTARSALTREKSQFLAMLRNKGALAEIIKQLIAGNGILRLGNQLIVSNLELIESLTDDNNTKPDNGTTNLEESAQVVGRGAPVEVMDVMSGHGPLGLRTNNPLWYAHHEIMKPHLSSQEVYSTGLANTFPRFQKFIDELVIKATASPDQQITFNVVATFTEQILNAVTAHLFPEFPAEDHPGAYRQIMDTFKKSIETGAIPVLITNKKPDPDVIAEFKQKLHDLTNDFFVKPALEARASGSTSFLARTAQFLDPNFQEGDIQVPLAKGQQPPAEKQKFYDPESFPGMINQMLSAATETTASTIAFALEALAKHPEWQARIRGEILQRWISFDGSKKSMKELAKYLQAEGTDLGNFGDEIFRIHPPTFFLPMNIKDQGKAFGVGENGEEIYLEEGIEIVLMLEALHTDPKYWTDPQTFNPDRFQEGDPAYNPKQKKAFRPFNNRSIRVCAGERMAKMQSRLMIAMLVNSMDVVTSQVDISINTGTHAPSKKSTVTLRPTA